MVRELPRSRVACASNVPARTVKRVRAGGDPSPANAAKLRAGAVKLARHSLRAASQTPSHEPHHALAAWAALSDSERAAGTARCAGPDCDEPLTGRQRRYHTEACRKAYERVNAREAGVSRAR